MVERPLHAGSNVNNIYGDGMRADEIPEGSNRDVKWCAHLVIEMRQRYNTLAEKRRILEEASVPT